MATALVSSISSLVASIAPGKQGFTTSIELNTISSNNMITFILIFILSVWILMLLGTWIFNNTIPKLIPSIRKASVLEFFGLYIVLHILLT